MEWAGLHAQLTEVINNMEKRHPSTKGKDEHGDLSRGLKTIRDILIWQEDEYIQEINKLHGEQELMSATVQALTKQVEDLEARKEEREGSINGEAITAIKEEISKEITKGVEEKLEATQGAWVKVVKKSIHKEVKEEIQKEVKEENH